MKLEIYDALLSINVPSEKAKAVAASIDAAIERRCSMHAQQLATRGDHVEAKNETITWCIGAIIGSIALAIAALSLLR